MNIVVLDGYTANPGDLSWDPFSAYGEVCIYDHTSEDQFMDRAKDADLLVTNKLKVTADKMARLPQLKCICLLATGFDNIDIDAARRHGIIVCNARDYGSTSVAQHVFALILHWTNQVGKHHASVQNGAWFDNEWSYSLSSMTELSGKVLGILGAGKIGKEVARLAGAFGMKVVVMQSLVSPSGRDRVSKDELLSISDFVTLHLPLTSQTRGIIDAKTLALMKPTSVLINTGRGGLIVEEDLKNALTRGTIAAALLDVLSSEPPPADHPLIGLQNCIITPHNAWATREARSRLLKLVLLNIEAYVLGQPINVVN